MDDKNNLNYTQFDKPSSINWKLLRLVLLTLVMAAAIYLIKDKFSILNYKSVTIPPNNNVSSSASQKAHEDFYIATPDASVKKGALCHRDSDCHIDYATCSAVSTPSAQPNTPTQNCSGQV